MIAILIKLIEHSVDITLYETYNTKNQVIKTKQKRLSKFGLEVKRSCETEHQGFESHVWDRERSLLRIRILGQNGGGIKLIGSLFQRNGTFIVFRTI